MIPERIIHCKRSGVTHDLNGYFQWYGSFSTATATAPAINQFDVRAQYQHGGSPFRLLLHRMKHLAPPAPAPQGSISIFIQALINSIWLARNVIGDSQNRHLMFALPQAKT